MVPKESNDGIDDYSNDIEKDRDEKGPFSSETVKGPASSKNSVQTRVNRKVETTSRVTNKPSKNSQAEVRSRSSRERTDKNLVHKKQTKASLNTSKKSAKSNGGISKEAKNIPGRKYDNIKVHPKPLSESSEGLDEKLIDEAKEIDLLEGVPNSSQNIGSDNESADTEENCLDEDQQLVEQKIEDMELKIKKLQDELRESSEGLDEKLIDEVKEIDLLEEEPNSSQNIGSDNESADVEKNGLDEDQDLVEQKIEDMELKIKKLEDELREIAALEISLYSVVAEHGSSSHKVHTPARRLSRLYIHACKYWTQDKRGSIARNSASGLVLVAKSCGNDIPRLTFWLSNTVVLREILSQAFPNSLHSSSTTRMVEPNGVVIRSQEKHSSFRWNGNTASKQVNIGFTQFADDWQETRTFTYALEKIESWIFSRIVESVWWQILTPQMQSPVEDAYTSKSNGRLLGPSLGDQKQGSFSVTLWRSAFQDAFQKLCPVRAGGHECGCLPVLARMVMEQCVTRLDVAMFNAILRESVHDIPTDPVSDPIVDSKVLPIPAGELSFGSGAQLKNSVGNWSRWLTDLLGMEIDESLTDELNSEENERHDTDVLPISFPLLNELSDLLMLPKDMLVDKSIRKEVCPSIGLSLIKRVLCNFTPDEFCPDSVPGSVLEALNAESAERGFVRGESTSNFPCSAAPVVYIPPPATHVAEKACTTETKYQLERNVSNIQRKGYTSDEELDELDSPLMSIVDEKPVSTGSKNEDHKEKACFSGTTIRYELLRDVWSI